MLVISQDTLPKNFLSYLAFRLSCMATLQFIELSRHLSELPLDCQGFLTEVPFLREVPPHVQVDLLAETWRKHISPDRLDATLVDESVVYAVCETASRIVKSNPELIRPLMEGGPWTMQVIADQVLSNRLEALHLNLSNQGDFLLVSQFLDMEPNEAARWKQRYGLSQASLKPMFDVLGRWHVSSAVGKNLKGLLTGVEIHTRLPLLGRLAATGRSGA